MVLTSPGCVDAVMLSKNSKKPIKRIEPGVAQNEALSPMERLSALNKKSLVTLIDHRRRSQRTSLNMIGEASFGQHSYSLYVIDGATGGLRLKLYDDVELPREFNLKILSLGFDQTVFLAWQRGLEAGVEF